MSRLGSPAPIGVDVLLVDDHRIFAEVLAVRLREEQQVASVRIAATLDEARAEVRRRVPDVVLLDYDVGSEPSTALIEDLHRLELRPRVLVLSASSSPDHVVSSLRAGADGWVPKTTPVAELLTATRAVVGGHMYVSPVTIRPLMSRILGAERAPTFVDQLSERELDVLRCLVQGMSRAEVAQRLFISTNTVRTHVQKLLKQSDEHSSTALANRARDLGVTGIDDDPPSAL